MQDYTQAGNSITQMTVIMGVACRIMQQGSGLFFCRQHVKHLKCMYAGVYVEAGYDGGGTGSQNGVKQE